MRGRGNNGYFLKTTILWAKRLLEMLLDTLFGEQMCMQQDVIIGYRRNVQSDILAK